MDGGTEDRVVRGGTDGVLVFDGLFCDGLFSLYGWSNDTVARGSRFTTDPADCKGDDNDVRDVG